LKVVLVNLNYGIGVHMNFARSRIPALFCSLRSEYVATRRVATGDNGAKPSPIPNFSG